MVILLTDDSDEFLLILLEPELLCMCHSTTQPSPCALHGLGTACFPSAYSLLQHLEVGLRSVIQKLNPNDQIANPFRAWALECPAPGLVRGGELTHC